MVHVTGSARVTLNPVFFDKIIPEEWIMRKAQKKERIARIRRAQKFQKTPWSRRIVVKSPTNRLDLEQIIGMAEEAVQSNTKFVREYAAIARREKNRSICIFLCGLILVAFRFFLATSEAEKGWTTFFSSIVFVFAFITSSGYIFYRSRRVFWEKQLIESIAALNGFNARLRQIKAPACK